MKIGILGAGVSGLSIAKLLTGKAEVEVLEKKLLMEFPSITIRSSWIEGKFPIPNKENFFTGLIGKITSTLDGN